MHCRNTKWDRAFEHTQLMAKLKSASFASQQLFSSTEFYIQNEIQQYFIFIEHRKSRKQNLGTEYYVVGYDSVNTESKILEPMIRRDTLAHTKVRRSWNEQQQKIQKKPNNSLHIIS